MHPKPGRSAIAVLVVACLVITAIAVWMRPTSSVSESETVLLHEVARGDFEAFITEPGDVVSSSNVEVRCLVESRNSPGASIVKICDEGTQVKEGDFLIQFDDSVLQNELIAQKIVVAGDKASLIQVKSDLANAERSLNEFTEGLYQKEEELLESAVFVAEEELRKNDLELASTQRLAARGVIGGLQVSASEFALEKSRKDVAAARRALNVYRQFTRERMVGEFEAEIEKQKANVEAATYMLELSKHKLSEIEEQIGHCYVTAPSEGQVVFANERDRGEPRVIEEGSQIRYQQIVIRLPDIRKMQVDVKVNESHINRVKDGQAAQIILDADPANVLEGAVTSVAPYPFPMRWHGAPLEYGVEVSILNPPATIRPGLRAKVKIFFESQPDVLQVPLAAVISHEKRHYCLVREQDNDWRAQQVSIGSNNNNQVVVLDGLAVGDHVALTPFRHIERADLPRGGLPAVVRQPSSSEPDAERLTVIAPRRSTKTPDRRGQSGAAGL